MFETDTTSTLKWWKPRLAGGCLVKCLAEGRFDGLGSIPHGS